MLHFLLYFKMLCCIYLYCYYSSLLILVISSDVELLEKCWDFKNEEREVEQELEYLYAAIETQHVGISELALSLPAH